jgi:hypothetical protein
MNRGVSGLLVGLLVAVGTMAGAGAAGAASTTPDNTLSLTDATGTRDYAPIDSNRGPSYFTATFLDLDTGEFVDLGLGAAPGKKLQARAYAPAPGGPSFGIATDDGPECDETPTSTFVVNEIKFHKSGLVALLDANFEYRCGDATLVGAVRWNEPDPAGTPTTTKLSASSAKKGKPVTFTVTVKNAKGGSMVPIGGTISLREQGCVCATAEVDAGGKAVVTMFLSRGKHTFSAVYNGDDGSHEPSTSKIVKVKVT